MKITIFLFAFGLLLNIAFGQQKQDEQLFSDFDKILLEQYKANETGAVALVARNGQIIYKKAFGMANLEYNIPMQIDNIFRIGSITKQFTAVAILQLMEQGKLQLQDDITQFIPDYPTHGYNITIEHLLTHTSGIKSYTDMQEFEKIMTLDMKPAELIDFFKNQPMEFSPGTNWNYNNSGYVLLGYIIEKVSGKTYREYIEENFFTSLDMTKSLYGDDNKIVQKRAGAYTKDSTGFVNAPYLSMTLPYAGGSIQSSVEDLFKWHQAVHSYKLIKKESLDKALSKYKLANGTETEYGYGWDLANIQQSPTIEHSGGINGFSATSIYLPQEDVFVAVFSNCDCNPPDVVGAKMAALVIGKPYEYKEISIENKLLQDYAGIYENEFGEQRFITLSNNQLYSQRNGGKIFNVKPYQKDKFYFENFMTTMEFARNGKGEIEKLTIKGRQVDEVWVKTN